IRTSILSYSSNAPGGLPSYPMRLEDLLQDNRSAGLRRHLRKIYIDPMTGKADWVLMPAPQGGIAGVHSRSTDTPLKQTGFRPRDMIFENKSSYSEWQFSALPPVPTAPPPGSQPGSLSPPPPPTDGR
ncbi:MAG TPA: hypothetical protein PLW86_02145, partial [Rhodocyclaceae bacterium]|nr:hypothetical protein [Rhodocyclaceae bacterium]